MSMWEPFTEEARRSIMLAQQEAQQLGHNYIGSEHIFLGLAADPQSSVAGLLQSNGVTIESARGVVEAVAGRGGQVAEQEMVFSPSAKRVIELAFMVARETGTTFVGPHHLFLGILRDPGKPMAVILRRLKMSPATLEKQTLQAIASAPPAQPQPPTARSETYALDEAVRAAAGRFGAATQQGQIELASSLKKCADLSNDESGEAIPKILATLLIVAQHRGWKLDDLLSAVKAHLDAL